MDKYHCPLQPELIYHIYTRAVGNEKLFLHEGNYFFFLQKMQTHIVPVADVLCWCLLPNHFHLMVQIRSEQVVKEQFHLRKRTSYSDDIVSDFLMERFSNLLNSYTKAFNKVNLRKGSLFIDFMRRIEIQHDEQFAATVFYIHKNPVHHGYCSGIEDWRWSSYKTFLSTSSTLVNREAVLERFQGVSQFTAYHQQPIALKSYVPIE